MAPSGREAVADRFHRVRARTEALARPLSAEDAMVQSMPDASPTKWHLGHTSWFFDEFVLGRAGGRHTWEDERWRLLFNSYYDAVGPQHARAARGVLSRPSLDAVKAWRSRVDGAISSVLRVAEESTLRLVELGTHHEEQHQELLLTDAKHALYANPLRPAYLPAKEEPSKSAPALVFEDFAETIAQIGASEGGFAFDNERPRHAVIVPAFRLASRLVTNGEFAAFVEGGGYDRPEWWLADGWATAQANHWRAPLYWEREGADFWAFGMGGMQPLDLHAPLAHVSFYEADAYARWSKARLPTEVEWERAAATQSDALMQMFAEVWQWTASAYTPYPGFRPLDGALGEYNGKFMSGQMVLRGGSCFSPKEHVRLTYRNYFPPGARWQVSGVRLAKDV